MEAEVEDEFHFLTLEIAPTPSRRKPSRGLASLKPWLVPAVGLMLHAAMFAAFLNYIGVVKVPGLARLTRDRVFPAQATIPRGPSSGLTTRETPLPKANAVAGGRERSGKVAPASARN